MYAVLFSTEKVINVGFRMSSQESSYFLRDAPPIPLWGRGSGVFLNGSFHLGVCLK